MPCINIPIEAVGPVVELGISAPVSQQGAGSPLPQIQWVRALVDTGCSHTAIHSTVAQNCGLSIVGIAPVTTPGGPVTNHVYHGDLILRPLIGGRAFEWRFGDCQITQMAHSNPAFEALLGMNILGIGLLAVDGIARSATFCW
jgi:hypothetical protein